MLFLCAVVFVWGLEFEAGRGKIGPAHRLQHSAAISAGGRNRAVKIRGIRPFWRLALSWFLRYRQIVAGGGLSQTRATRSAVRGKPLAAMPNRIYSPCWDLR